MKRSLVVEDSFHCPDNITSYISFPLFHFSFLSFLLLFFLSKFLWKYNVYRKVCCCLVVKSCPTLCNLPGSSVCGILQARILDWVAIPSPGDLPNPEIEPSLPHVGKFFTIEPPWKSQTLNYKVTYVIDLPLTLKNCVIENECYSYFHIPLPSKKKKKVKDT